MSALRSPAPSTDSFSRTDIVCIHTHQRRLTSRRSQPPLALSVPRSRFTSSVGGGSAFFVRRFLAYPVNEDQNKPTSTLTPRRVRRVVLVLTSLLLLYVVSFSLNTFSGGYRELPDRDGRDRYSFGLSMTTAVLWQPRFGYWTPFRSDWLGAIYSPLIRLDRRFLHPTHYLTDPLYDSWAKTSPASLWHPDSPGASVDGRRKHE